MAKDKEPLVAAMWRAQRACEDAMGSMERASNHVEHKDDASAIRCLLLAKANADAAAYGIEGLLYYLNSD